MAETNIDKVVRRAVNELWNRGNTGVLSEIYDENCKLDVPGIEASGHEGIKNFLGMYREAFPDLHIEINRLYTDTTGKHAAVHWTSTGTHKGPLAGAQPTGKSISIDGVTLSKFRGGRITEERFFWDRVEQLELLGLSPEDTSW